jgi:hypothetical protein
MRESGFGPASRCERCSAGRARHVRRCGGDRWRAYRGRMELRGIVPRLPFSRCVSYRGGVSCLGLRSL